MENKRELDARAEVGIPQPIQTNNLLKESGKEIIEKINMVEKFDKPKKIFDNYGLAKEVTDQLWINCRFYDLRGSFATKALRNGSEIKDISKVLGHSRIETTENYYITSTTNDLIKISESIEKEIDINLRDKF